MTKALPAAARQFLFVVSVIGGLLAAYTYVKGAPLIVDEHAHYKQISQFLAGDFSHFPRLTTIPGYHYTVWALAELFSISGIGELRLLSLGLGVFSVVVVFALARRMGAPTTKTLQFVTLPLLFPLFFLLYTDAFSLLLVLLSVGLALDHKYRLAGVAAIAACLVRQNNIVWLLFVLALAYQQSHGSALTASAVRRHLRAHWLFLLGLAAFAAFVVINGGVALGMQSAHPSFSFHTGNVFFLLFLVFFLFLPLHLANTRAIGDLLRRKVVIAGLAAVFLVYMLTFDNSHPGNNVWGHFFLRNKILIYFSSSAFLKTVFFVPIAVVLVSLATIRLKRPSYYLMYPFTVLFLLPSWLIEQRYYLIPLSLFIVFKEEKSKWVEYVTIAAWAGCSGVLLYFVEQRALFL